MTKRPRRKPEVVADENGGSAEKSRSYEENQQNGAKEDNITSRAEQPLKKIEERSGRTTNSDDDRRSIRETQRNKVSSESDSSYNKVPGSKKVKNHPGIRPKTVADENGWSVEKSPGYQENQQNGTKEDNITSQAEQPSKMKKRSERTTNSDDDRLPISKIQRDKVSSESNSSDNKGPRNKKVKNHPGRRSKTVADENGFSAEKLRSYQENQQNGRKRRGEEKSTFPPKITEINGKESPKLHNRKINTNVDESSRKVLQERNNDLKTANEKRTKSWKSCCSAFSPNGEFEEMDALCCDEKMKPKRRNSRKRRGCKENNLTKNMHCSPDAELQSDALQIKSSEGKFIISSERNSYSDEDFKSRCTEEIMGARANKQNNNLQTKNSSLLATDKLMKNPTLTIFESPSTKLDQENQLPKRDMMCRDSFSTQAAPENTSDSHHSLKKQRLKRLQINGSGCKRKKLRKTPTSLSSTSSKSRKISKKIINIIIEKFLRSPEKFYVEKRTNVFTKILQGYILESKKLSRQAYRRGKRSEIGTAPGDINTNDIKKADDADKGKAGEKWYSKRTVKPEDGEIHVGILGNELADSANASSSSCIVLKVTDMRRQVKVSSLECLQDEFLATETTLGNMDTKPITKKLSGAEGKGCSEEIVNPENVETHCRIDGSGIADSDTLSSVKAETTGMRRQTDVAKAFDKESHVNEHAFNHENAENSTHISSKILQKSNEVQPQKISVEESEQEESSTGNISENVRETTATVTRDTDKGIHYITKFKSEIVKESAYFPSETLYLRGHLKEKQTAMHRQVNDLNTSERTNDIPEENCEKNLGSEDVREHVSIFGNELADSSSALSNMNAKTNEMQKHTDDESAIEKAGDVHKRNVFMKYILKRGTAKKPTNILQESNNVELENVSLNTDKQEEPSVFKNVTRNVDETVTTVTCGADKGNSPLKMNYGSKDVKEHADISGNELQNRNDELSNMEVNEMQIQDNHANPVTVVDGEKFTDTSPKTLQENNDLQSEKQADQQEDSSLLHSRSQPETINEKRANNRHNMDSTNLNASNTKEHEDITSRIQTTEIAEACILNRTKNSYLHFDAEANLVLPTGTSDAMAMLDVLSSLAVDDLAKNPELDIRRKIHQERNEILKLKAEKNSSSENDDKITEKEYNLTILQDSERCLKEFGTFENAAEHFLRNAKMQEFEEKPQDDSLEIVQSSGFSSLVHKESLVSRIADIQEATGTRSLDNQTPAGKHANEFLSVKSSLSSKEVPRHEGISEDESEILMDFSHNPEKGTVSSLSVSGPESTTAGTQCNKTKESGALENITSQSENNFSNAEIKEIQDANCLKRKSASSEKAAVVKQASHQLIVIQKVPVVPAAENSGKINVISSGKKASNNVNCNGAVNTREVIEMGKISPATTSSSLPGQTRITYVRVGDSNIYMPLDAIIGTLNVTFL